MALRPNTGHDLPILEVCKSHTTTQHSGYDFSGRVITASQRPVPDNTQHSQQTDVHTLGGIRIHSLSRRSAVDLRLRPRGRPLGSATYCNVCKKIFPFPTLCLCDGVTATVNSDYCIGANTINLCVFVINMQCVYCEIVCVCVCVCAAVHSRQVDVCCV